jgi:hypothetical protein
VIAQRLNDTAARWVGEGLERVYLHASVYAR